MDNKKYYCVLLKECYDNEITLASGSTCSHIQDVLDKEYTTLDIETLRDDFLMQDNRILERENNWRVMGSFPIIAEERDGQLFDVITGIEFEKIDENKPPLNYRDIKKIYYTEAKPATKAIVKALLESLDEVSLARYRGGLQAIRNNQQVRNHKLEKPRYYHLELTDTDNEERRKYPIYAEEVGGRMVEYITKTPIYCSETNAIKSNITYETATPISRVAFLAFLNSIYMGSEKVAEGYRKFLKEQKHKSALKYNNYTTMDIPRISKERENTSIKTKKLVINERLAR